jgi:hypothetical protein
MKSKLGMITNTTHSLPCEHSVCGSGALLLNCGRVARTCVPIHSDSISKNTQKTNNINTVNVKRVLNPLVPFKASFGVHRGKETKA